MLLLSNIRQLLTCGTEHETFKKGKTMQEVGLIENAYLLINPETGKIADFGEMSDFVFLEKITETIDCSGRVVLPGLVDSHTHLIFAQPRTTEFVLRLKGATYEEIAQAGGGILNSAQKMANASEEELLEGALLRCKEVLKTGTVALEIKSGYGLTLESELKMLRVAQKLKSIVPQTIKTTFLGAHAIPTIYKANREKYIELICQEMIPQVAQERLAEYVDVFCETGFFTPAETERILTVGADYGLKGRVHANELDYSGGVQVGVKCKAVSVDHLECVGQAEVEALLSSDTIPTLLPATAFFLKIPYAPARMMIDAGLGFSLASDYNPGTCPTGNLPFIMALACTQMKLLPQEAIIATTLNASKALELSDTHGKIVVGKPAHLIITEKMDSFYELPYFFATPKIAHTLINGKIVTA